MPDLRQTPAQFPSFSNFMTSPSVVYERGDIVYERTGTHPPGAPSAPTYYFPTPPQAAMHGAHGVPDPAMFDPAFASLPLHAATTPRFRSKPVCKLVCRYCASPVCHRGMKAILLADSGVELFSTDSPPPTVGFIKEDYVTEKCLCRIRDVACLSCGNLVGYHVTQPCKACLASCNNGHFWMFHKQHVRFSERTKGNKSLVWAELPGIDKDAEIFERKWESYVR